MQLTVRSYTDENREALLTGIKRMTNAQAKVMGFPESKLPLIKVRDEFTPALYNDPALTSRVTTVLKKQLGEERVVRVKPVMGGEDFSEYGRTEHKVPGFFLLAWRGRSKNA